MKRLIVVVAALVLAFAAVQAQAATIVGSRHDMKANAPSTEVCVFCHTPHQSGTTVDPLWNHTLSTNATYGVYASVTLNAVPTEIGGGTAVSNLCMSCHDGTVGLGSLYNQPNAGNTTNLATIIGGAANMGTSLANDHPVNFSYTAALVTADGGLVVQTAPAVAALLSGGTVQCSSCHDAHDPQFTPFLRATNVNSALCLTCHIK